MDAADLKIGARITGHVAHIAPFGAFIDLGDAEWQGLVLIPEIAWGNIGHPSDVLVVGQPVETEVLRIVPERHQVSLSIKRLQENPWDVAAKHYHVGQTVEVIVSRIVSFGVWAHLKEHPAITGLLPLVETNQRDWCAGQILTVRIASFELDKQRMVFQSQG